MCRYLFGIGAVTKLTLVVVVAPSCIVLLKGKFSTQFTLYEFYGMFLGAGWGFIRNLVLTLGTSMHAVSYNLPNFLRRSKESYYSEEARSIICCI